MDCGGVRALINRYIDGELGYVETAEFQHHLDFCPDCSQELRETGELRGALAAWGGVPLATPAGFAARVAAAAERQPPPGAPRPLGEIVDEGLDRLDEVLGRVKLPYGHTIPVKNLIGWGLAVAAVVIGLGRRRGHDEPEVRTP
jgi:anti-sigma factor RsiW